ncbi:hypothetical protein BH09BAC6_BH09BAC6_12160 [soil metagenome]|jgi:DNA-binding winged helix-turn-helix (wHTH) protein
MQPFKINDEFTVFPLTNQVSQAAKIEPRLMKLLCLLVSHSGKLVTREEIVEKIWDGYGGGDEGLTQAISFLRKLLNDKDKTIIETVPKSGYIFRGKTELLHEAASRPLPMGKQTDQRTFSYKAAAFVAFVIILAFAFVYYLFLPRRDITPKPEAPAAREMPAARAPKAK